jgi:hypothetical protein
MVVCALSVQIAEGNTWRSYLLFLAPLRLQELPAIFFPSSNLRSIKEVMGIIKVMISCLNPFRGDLFVVDSVGLLIVRYRLTLSSVPVTAVRYYVFPHTAFLILSVCLSVYIHQSISARLALYRSICIYLSVRPSICVFYPVSVRPAI